MAPIVNAPAASWCASWAVGVLIEAAELALLTDQIDLATSCLELACRCGARDAERATILAALTDVEWRTGSLRAAHRFPQLLAALRDGHLEGPKSLWVLQMLVWYGWFDPAEDIIDRLADMVGTRDPRVGFLRSELETRGRARSVRYLGEIVLGAIDQIEWTDSGGASWVVRGGAHAGCGLLAPG